MLPPSLLAEPAWLLLLGPVMLLGLAGQHPGVVAVTARHRVAARRATRACDCPGCEGNPLTMAASGGGAADAFDTFKRRIHRLEPGTIDFYTDVVGMWLRYLKHNSLAYDRADEDTLDRWLHLPEARRNPPVHGGRRRRGRRAEYLSPASKVSYSIAVRRFYQELCRGKVLKADRMAGFVPLRKPRPKRRTIARQAIREVIAAAAGSDRRLWAMLWTGYRGARRAVEIARMQVDDIDLVAGTMDVRGKGGRGEVTQVGVPLHPELAEVLADYMAGLPASGPLFASRGWRPGRHLSAQTVVRIYGRVLKPYGETGHVLRHLMAQETQVAGGDSDATAGLTGHTNPATLRIYTGAATEHTRRALAKVPRLAREFPVTGAPGRILGAHHAGQRLSTGSGPRLHQRGGRPDDRTGAP